MEDIKSRDIQQLMKLIISSGNIAIIGHMKPDGDALGSCVAMFHFLGQCGVEKRHIIFPDAFPAYIDFITEGMEKESILTHTDDPETAERAIRDSDLIICLDFNAFHRTDRLENALMESSAKKILIDHHLNPDHKHFEVVFSETEVSSASELLFHVLKATPVTEGQISRLDPRACTALMTGMTTDTNNFANSTYPSTLKMASELLEAGVDRDLIVHNLYNRHSENRMRLMGHVLKDLMTITSDGVAYIVLDSRTQKEYEINDGDTEGFVNLPLAIDKVRMSLLLKEDGDRVRVSIRSKKGTSANICAKEHFNGGGHEYAAGGRLYIGQEVGSIKDAAAYIEEHTHLFLNGK